MSDKMRVDFQNWKLDFESDYDRKPSLWECWQAAAQSEQRIKELERKLAEQQVALHAKNAALSRWTIGTCVCNTKTPAPSHHALNCLYRIACDGIDIQPSSEELTRLLQEAEQRGVEKVLRELHGMTEAMREAAKVLEAVATMQYHPDMLRLPLVDELCGFAAMADELEGRG